MDGPDESRFNNLCRRVELGGRAALVQTRMEESSQPLFEPLTFEEGRVLGCLVEKESTTPDYYPMTLNALTTACNQSTSRDPVVSFDERTVQTAIEGLKSHGLAFQVSQAGARAVKFKHNLPGKFPHLDEAPTALLCTLILRGPQTVGELRQRSERMVPFPDIPAVESELTKLMEYPGGPLIMVLQFVGFVGGWQHPGALSPLAAATLGAAITTWVTFLPCFLFVFLGAPHIEKLGQQPKLSAALTAITAAVVGVILNLGVKFTQDALWPKSGPFDLFVAALAIAAFIAMQRFKIGLMTVIGACAAFGLAKHLLLG